MKFTIATRGANIAKDVNRCDSFINYEEKCGRVIMRQIIDNTGEKTFNPSLLASFLKHYKTEALICECIDEESIVLLKEEGIMAITGICGNVEKHADEFAATIKKQANMKSCLQPTPKVLVSCRGTDGENNVLAVGYCGNCSYAPPMVMVGIVPSRYSYKIIKESGCFVVNLVDQEYKDTFNYLGKHSKRDGDKLAAINLKLQDGVKVNAPYLPECPVNIECTVVDSVLTGSHEMFIGKVEYVHADAKLVDKSGDIDFSRIKFL